MDTRTNLLACALRLFASHGYDSVGVQKIVETAGVTKPTLYHYFESKQGLLNTLLEEYFEKLYQMVQPAAVYHGDLSLLLNSIASAYFSFAKESPDFYRLQVSLYFTPPEHEAHKLVVPLQSKLYQMVEELFGSVAKDYQNLQGRQSYCAATFLGLIEHWIALALNGYVKLDSQLVHHTVQQFLYGILANP